MEKENTATVTAVVLQNKNNNSKKSWEKKLHAFFSSPSKRFSVFIFKMKLKIDKNA